MYEIERITKHMLPDKIVFFVNNYVEYKIMIDGEIEILTNIKPNEINYYYEQRDLFGYDVIPISYINDDFICLFYLDDKIKVIYWSSERALESIDSGVFLLYDNIETFWIIV